MKSEMHKFFLALIGIGAGIASFYIQHFTGWGWRNFLSDLAPGIVFGIATVFYFIWISARSPRFRTGKFWIVLWIGVSTVAYFAADTVGRYLTGKGLTPPGQLSFFGAGLTGAILLALGFDFFFIRLKITQFLLLGILGGILGLIDFYGDPLYVWLAGPQTGWAAIDLIGAGLTLYVIWQAGIAFTLGWIIDKHAKAKQ